MQDIASFLEKKMKLQEALTGQLFTLIWINSMAVTCTLRGKATAVVFPVGKEPILIFRKGRERRLRTLTVKPNMLLFAGGRSVPILSDFEADFGTWHGNTCLNITARSPVFALSYIEEHNLNPYFNEETRARIIHLAKGAGTETVQTLLYPELETTHAVIRHLKSRKHALT